MNAVVKELTAATIIVLLFLLRAAYKYLYLNKIEEIVNNRNSKN